MPTTMVTPQPPAPTPTVTDLIGEIRGQTAAEMTRIQAIRTFCAGRAPDLELRAVREGWDLMRCELEFLRSNRPQVPAPRAPAAPAGPAIHMVDRTVNAQMLEAACMATAGLANVEQLFDAQTLDQAQQPLDLLADLLLRHEAMRVVL